MNVSADLKPFKVRFESEASHSTKTWKMHGAGLRLRRPGLLVLQAAAREAILRGRGEGRGQGEYSRDWMGPSLTTFNRTWDSPPS